MVALDSILPYLATAFTLVLSVVGFFWARGGERNKVGGVGWLMLAFTLVAGAIALLQAYRSSDKARVASAAAADAGERLRQAQLRQSALMTWLLAGTDLRTPVGSVGFDFLLPMTGGEEASAQRIPGFVGPFPKLEGRSRGVLSISVGQIIQDFRLLPARRGGVAIEAMEVESPRYTLSDDGREQSMTAPGVEPYTEGAYGSYRWNAQAEVDGNMWYGTNLPANVQFRRLLSDLTQSDQYGHLYFRLPASSPEVRNGIIAAYSRMLVFFTLSLTAKNDFDADGNPCITYIRVPLSLVHRPTRSPERLLFDLRLAADGFRTEVCEGEP